MNVFLLELFADVRLVNAVLCKSSACPDSRHVRSYEVDPNDPALRLAAFTGWEPKAASDCESVAS